MVNGIGVPPVDPAGGAKEKPALPFESESVRLAGTALETYVKLPVADSVDVNGPAGMGAKLKFVVEVMLDAV